MFGVKKEGVNPKKLSQKELRAAEAVLDGILLFSDTNNGKRLREKCKEILRENTEKEN